MNQKKIKISVIMTVKNGENFIQKSIQSIMQQTLSPCEIVIVDDGSTDQTKILVEKLSLQTDIPINFIETGGIGRAKALNLAIENTRGNWVANLDVDDLWHQKKLELQAQVIQQSTESFIVTDSIIIDDIGTLLEDIGEMGNYEISELDKKSFYLKNPVNHSSIIMRKSILQDINLYNEKLSKQIDLDMWVRILENNYKFVLIRKKLTAKRVHKEQSFESKQRFQYILGAFIQHNKLLNKLNAPIYYYLIPIVKFFFNVSPTVLRNKLKRMLNVKK